VRINSIDVIDINGVEVEFKVSCSSGTYIRAIARDLGEALGVGGHLTSLRRTSVGSFDHGFTLEELSDDFTMVPIAQAARATFPTVELDESMSNDVRVGRKLTLDLGAPGEVALFDPEGTFLALYKQRDDQAVAVAVFV
jgi:tRNA pseudouridine55 synthase